MTWSPSTPPSVCTPSYAATGDTSSHHNGTTYYGLPMSIPPPARKKLIHIFIKYVRLSIPETHFKSSLQGPLLVPIM